MIINVRNIFLFILVSQGLAFGLEFKVKDKIKLLSVSKSELENRISNKNEINFGDVLRTAIILEGPEFSTFSAIYKKRHLELLSWQFREQSHSLLVLNKFSEINPELKASNKLDFVLSKKLLSKTGYLLTADYNFCSDLKKALDYGSVFMDIKDFVGALVFSSKIKNDDYKICESVKNHGKKVLKNFVAKSFQEVILYNALVHSLDFVSSLNRLGEKREVKSLSLGMELLKYSNDVMEIKSLAIREFSKLKVFDIKRRYLALTSIDKSRTPASLNKENLLSITDLLRGIAEFKQFDVLDEVSKYNTIKVLYSFYKTKNKSEVLTF